MKKTIALASTLLLSGHGFLIAQISANATSHVGRVVNGEQRILAQAMQQPLPPVAPANQPLAPLGFALADGTPVKLKFKQTLSSKTAQTNDPVEFEVIEDVRVGNRAVIKRGAIAKGIITEAKPSGMMGRKGKLEIAVKEVELASGERVAIRSIKESGGGHSTTTLALAAALSPFFLLMKGKNVTYEAGTEFNVFVNGNYELNPVKFN